MKSRCLAKSTSAVAMIAIMGTATICPPSFSCRFSGRIRNRIYPTPQLRGTGGAVEEDRIVWMTPKTSSPRSPT